MNSDSALGAAVATAITALFAWLIQRSKGRVDESVAVRQEWEKLTGSLSARLSTVEREFAEFRSQSAKEMAELRKKHADELEEMRKRHRAEMKAMREMNEGLQRMIAQNSKSSAHLMGQALLSPEMRRAFGDGEEGGEE